jgi:hypothetical protein
MRMAEVQAFFLGDRAAFVIKPAGGDCRERFTRIGQDRGGARCRLIASDIELYAPARPPRILGGHESRPGAEERVEHNLATVR